MNFLVLPCALALAVCVIAQAQDDAGIFYDSRYDYLDIDAILSSKRLVRNYVDCLLNQKPCSPEGKALRRILPEGLRTKCARCTPRQKHNALMILRGLRDHYPAEWSKLSSKWDPSGDFTKRFVAFLDKDDNNKVDNPIQPAQPSEIEQPIQPVRPSLPMMPIQPMSVQPMQPSSMAPPRPMVVNRFGSDQGEQGSSSEVRPTVRAPPATARSMMPTTASPSTMSMPTPTPVMMMKARPNRPRPVATTRFPEYEFVSPDTRPVMGLIDHFGNKIIKTTELVTDLLKNTVRIVVG